MNTVWCPACMLAFPVTRDNASKLSSPQPCSACRGTKVIPVKNEAGKLVEGRCPVCLGEGQLLFTARCTHQRGDQWCRESVLIPKPVADKTPWLGRPNPQTRAAQDVLMRNISARRIREASHKAARKPRRR